MNSVRGTYINRLLKSSIEVCPSCPRRPFCHQRIGKICRNHSPCSAHRAVHRRLVPLVLHSFRNGDGGSQSWRERVSEKEHEKIRLNSRRCCCQMQQWPARRWLVEGHHAVAGR